MKIVIVEEKALARSHDGHRKAQSAYQRLVDQGWARYNSPGWDKPVVLAQLEDGRVVAGIVYDIGEKDAELDVQFAWCDQAYPEALVRLAGRIRALGRAAGCVTISYGRSPHNAPMARLGEIIGAQCYSMSFRAPL